MFRDIIFCTLKKKLKKVKDATFNTLYLFVTIKLFCFLHLEVNFLIKLQLQHCYKSQNLIFIRMV